MSDGLDLNLDLPQTEEPLSDAVRRMRWFMESFRSVAEKVSAETGVTYEVETSDLARAFVAWLRKVEAAKPSDPASRRAFFDHAAGMMLRELLVAGPVTVSDMPDETDRDRPEHFWPEGFLYTVYCMNVRGAALLQEYGESSVMSAQVNDSRAWWSFKENVGEDPAYSVAFFKLFSGSEPNWMMPDNFSTEDTRALHAEMRAPALD